jgi:hypothetical protein
MNIRHVHVRQPLLTIFTSSSIPSVQRQQSGTPEMEPQMDTVPERVPGSNDCAERILEIVLGLQQQIAHYEAEFRFRSKRAIEETHHVEGQLRALSERAALEAQAHLRQAVTEKLLSRFDIEICRLEADFDQRMQEAIRDAEASVQVRLDESQQSVVRLEEQTRTDAAEWRAEKQSLLDRIATMERSLDAANAFNIEELAHYKEVERKLEEALLLKAQLGLDLQRVASELSAPSQAKAQHDSDRAAHGEVATIVHCEVARVQSRCGDIEKTLADPSIDLAADMRLNREWTELQAYLKGLRFSLGEVTLQPSALQDACNA